MSLTYFSELFLPYCLSKKHDVTFVITNREYMPLGEFRVTDKKNKSVNIDIPQSLLAHLDSYDDRPDMWWFYNDKTNPAHSKKNTDRYMDILSCFLNNRVFDGLLGEDELVFRKKINKKYRYRIPESGSIG